MGHKRILWGLHLFISTYFPRLSKPRYLFVSKRASFDPLQVKLPNSQNDTTHFNQNFSASSESVLQDCKSQRSKVRLGFNGHLRTADPNMLALLAIFFSFCRNMQKCTRAKKGVKMVIKLTNVENSCKKSSRRGQLRIQPQFLRIGCNFLGEKNGNCCCKVSHLLGF